MAFWTDLDVRCAMPVNILSELSVFLVRILAFLRKVHLMLAPVSVTKDTPLWPMDRALLA